MRRLRGTSKITRRTLGEEIRRRTRPGNPPSDLDLELLADDSPGGFLRLALRRGIADGPALGRPARRRRRIPAEW